MDAQKPLTIRAMNVPTEIAASMGALSGGVTSEIEMLTSCVTQEISLELTDLVIKPPGSRRLLHSAAYQGLPHFTRRALKICAEVALTQVTDLVRANQLAQSQI